MLWPCVEAVSPQVDQVAIVDNASSPPVVQEDWTSNVHVYREELQPPNIAYMWNTQIDRFTAQEQINGNDGRHPFEIAFLCDDVVVPPDWFGRVTSAMREHGAAAGSAHSYSPIGTPIVKREHDGDIHNRMCGWAFILAGEKGLRADESMKWWFQDTSVDWDARLNGGTVIAPGPIAVNQRPNDFTNSVPGLAEQAGRDREAFGRRWGSVPW